MLFQFFVNKCTHKIDTLYNTQQKKKHLYCRQFFWCDNQQTTTTNNKKQNKKKTKKTQKTQKTQKNKKNKKTIEQYIENSVITIINFVGKFLMTLKISTTTTKK